jgi:hypothetical protein
MAALRVAVVGTCASGKSSVVSELRRRGYDAWAVAQEHSIIHELWRHQHPDRVVYLQTSLDAIRRRRNAPRWPEWIYTVQLQRLENARSNADLIVDTDALDLPGVVQQIVSALDRPQPS